MAPIKGFVGEYAGLSNKQAEEGYRKYGPNEINKEKEKGLIRIIWEAVSEPMFLLLFAAALIYFFLGEIRDGMIMSAFVVFMAGIEIYQESKTDRTLAALKDLTSPKAKVVRDGELVVIDAACLTVGDYLLVEEGERIPADARIIEEYDLTVDESMLTGESMPVTKDVKGEEGEGHFLRSHIYCGTNVINGRAMGEVTHIGLSTEYGKIAKDIMEAPDRPTPLEKQMGKLVKNFTLIGLGLLILVFIATYINTNGNIIDSILSGVTLAMGIIPEEFPVILTVFLSMGAWRLAKKNTLIRRLPSVETLGAVSVLCVDKTGTLTQNRMALTESYTEVEEKEFLQLAVYACEPDESDPMDKAVHDKAREVMGELSPYTPLHEYPFTRKTMIMGHVTDSGIVAAKGSPEGILPLCSMPEEKRKDIESRIDAMAKKGLRVLALAICRSDEIHDELQDYTFAFIGLLGFSDPPREGVREAIGECRRAGVRVVMITGDNAVTAASIGTALGIDSGRVLTGAEIDAMDDEALSTAIKSYSIFARVVPAHKMRLVTAFRNGGDIVAMTGDGVNDAPALKYADIGIAMGGRGTQVAREAADMVLLDDNFTTIVETVRDGRRIYENIRKAISYVLSIHIPIALLALIVPVFGAPLMLLPIHIVLMELIIDPTCSIIFERQGAEPDIMSRPPRARSEQLTTKKLVFKSVVQGLAIFLASVIPYLMLQAQWGESAARSFSFATLILANLLLVNVNMSESNYSWVNFARSLKEPVMLGINLLVPAVLICFLYIPPLASIGRFAPLPLGMLGLSVLAAAVSTLWWDGVRFAGKLQAKKKAQGEKD